MQTCQALTTLNSEVIKMPQSRAQFQSTADGFKARCGIPGVIGAIDGTHMAVPGLRSEHRASYINRKGYPSVHLQVVCDSNLRLLQVVCDSNLRLLDTYTGCPGSVHDARVFRSAPCMMCARIYLKNFIFEEIQPTLFHPSSIKG